MNFLGIVFRGIVIFIGINNLIFKNFIEFLLYGYWFLSIVGFCFFGICYLLVNCYILFE